MPYLNASRLLCLATVFTRLFSVVDACILPSPLETAVLDFLHVVYVLALAGSCRLCAYTARTDRLEL